MFRNGFRGYDANQVDDFLATVADEVRRSADREAEDVRQSARREAELTRRSARREAEFTVKDAQARSHQMLADSEPLIERVQDSYEALQDAKRSFADDLRRLLKTYTEMMESMEVSSAREIEAAREAAPREAAAQEEPSDDATDG